MDGGNALLKLASEVEKLASDAAQIITRGSVGDWEKYREKVAEIRAYQKSAEMIRELHARIFHHED